MVSLESLIYVLSHFHFSTMLRHDVLMWQARSVVLEIHAFQEILSVFLVWNLGHLGYFYSGFFQGVKDCWPSGRRHRSEERESNKITTRNVKKGATTFALVTSLSLALTSLLT